MTTMKSAKTGATGGDLTPGMRLFGAAATAYRAAVAGNPLAQRLARPDPVRPSGYDIDVVVDSSTVIAEDIRGISLRRADGESFATWRPGSHIDVFLPTGMQRSYSLCGDPTDRGSYRISVRRLPAGDGGSLAMHELRPGDTLRIRGPRNAFPFHTAPSYLFVAGGIGITAILPMVRAAEAAGARWRMVYLGRSRDSMAYLDELAELAANSATGTVVVEPDDERGRPDIVRTLATAEPGAAVYMCGPPAMMTTARGIIGFINPTATLHTERFSPTPVRGGHEFTVLVPGLSKAIDVGPDETTLDALRREIPGVAYSCRQGFCGSCRVGVIQGEVDHRDRHLTAQERERNMMPCVSRAAGSTLTLDLSSELHRSQDTR